MEVLIGQVVPLFIEIRLLGTLSLWPDFRRTLGVEQFRLDLRLYLLRTQALRLLGHVRVVRDFIPSFLPDFLSFISFLLGFVSPSIAAYRFIGRSCLRDLGFFNVTRRWTLSSVAGC